jgi:hypothetical protein
MAEGWQGKDYLILFDENAVKSMFYDKAVVIGSSFPSLKHTTGP